jgi:hypothetical protein
MRFFRTMAPTSPLAGALLITLSTSDCFFDDHTTECEEALSAYSDRLLEHAAQVADAEAEVSKPTCDTTGGPPPWVSVAFGPDAELDYVSERVTSAGFTPGEELDSEGTITQVFEGPDGFEVWVELLETRVDATVVAPRES